MRFHLISLRKRESMCLKGEYENENLKTIATINEAMKSISNNY